MAGSKLWPCGYRPRRPPRRNARGARLLSAAIREAPDKRGFTRQDSHFGAHGTACYVMLSEKYTYCGRDRLGRARSRALALA